MLVEDANIPRDAWRVRVSVIATSRRLAGKVGIAWPAPRANDLQNWALFIPGQPSVIYCHAKILEVLEQLPSDQPMHFGDPCIYCGIPHDEVPVGPCRGRESK